MGFSQRSLRTLSLTAEDSLYPVDFPYVESFPKHTHFEVFTDPTLGKGIRAKVDFARGGVMARFTGHLTSEILQHTLQVSPTSHVHDPYFIGLLSHSCAPNSILDMTHLDLLALTDIAAGDILTVDYALTEDTLFRQFPCGCGSDNCRHWITGRRQSVSEEGRVHLGNRRKIA